PRNRPSPQCAIETNRRGIIRQCPNHHALDAALRQVASCRRKQAAPEAETLKLRSQVELVDFSLVSQASRPVPAIVSIACNSIPECHYRNSATLADRTFPPLRAAPIDQLVQLRTRDDALVRRTPSQVVRGRKRLGIGRSGTADFDGDGMHDG